MQIGFHCVALTPRCTAAPYVGITAPHPLHVTVQQVEGVVLRVCCAKAYPCARPHPGPLPRRGLRPLQPSPRPERAWDARQPAFLSVRVQARVLSAEQFKEGHPEQLPGAWFPTLAGSPSRGLAYPSPPQVPHA